MGIVGKCAAGVVGAGTIAAGGWGINHLMNVEPRVITLKETKNKPDAGKWWESAEDKDNLVSNDPENEPWWNWKYKHAFLVAKDKKEETKASNMDSLFEAVKRGYSADKALNQVCWEVYGKDKADVEGNNNLKANVKDFCSVVVKKAG